MSNKKDKVTDKASEFARHIWLAGVGAYGRAVDEAQSSLKKATPQPPKLFRELVKAGAALEEEANEATAAARASVEERIAQVRENFHLQRPARVEDLQALHSKIDELTRQVEALADQLQAQQKKAAPKRKAKAAVKKAAARKTPAKKAPARQKAAVKQSPAAAKAKAPAKRQPAARRKPAAPRSGAGDKS
ncbi:phasin family protein [Haliea sp. E17]|uniref:phasin family protein n=1 Tax=Haliea sp. E17 TaxID=3401576 RepID=UPI003AAA33B9